MIGGAVNKYKKKKKKLEKQKIHLNYCCLVTYKEHSLIHSYFCFIFHLMNRNIYYFLIMN